MPIPCLPQIRPATLALALALALTAQAHAATPAPAPASVSAPAPAAADELRQIAVEAYLYAYPLVLMDVTRTVSTSVPAPTGIHAPINQFAHVPAFPDADFTDVVRPNADTLYSVLWYDVSQEPLLVRTPDSHGRYFLLEMLDMWSDVYSVPGTRTTGNEARQFAIVGPHWQGKLPAGVTPYRSPTDGGWIIGRTQTNGTADYAAVHQFQAGISATPLSAWSQPSAHAAHHNSSAGASAAAAASRAAPVQQVAAMDGATFFARFASLRAANPPHANDYPMLDRLARLGLAPDQPFDAARLTPAARAAIDAAPALARAQIVRAVRQAGAPVNGWRIVLNPIGSYGTDYLRRAAIAFAGLGANPIEDAIYPFGLTDADGKPFDSAASYTIHFDAAQLPPARAFWSLTLYNDQQFFAANPIGRYAIGDRDALQYNPDGSLDLLIQRAAPAPERRSNWLPAPASGGFTFNLRLYWPKPAALEGGWSPPPVRRLP